MKTVPPRPLDPEEVAMIRSALERASLGRVPAGALDALATLSVVGNCDCGCRSVFFREPASGDYPVADGVGYLPDGERVGILVWANSNGLAALEFVDHAGGGKLPASESVCSWEEAGKREAKR